MNSKERIRELKLEIYRTVVNNNWRLTVITYDGKSYSGGLLRQREPDNVEDVVIMIITDDNEEIEVRLKNIKEVGQ